MTFIPQNDHRQENCPNVHCICSGKLKFSGTVIMRNFFQVEIEMKKKKVKI